MPREPERADDLADLYDRLGPALYRYALMILGDPAGAEDVVQDVFVSIARRRADGVTSIDAYLKLAVRNGCYDVLRRRRARPEVQAGTVLLEARGPHDDPAERMALESALRSVPAEQREVVHLKIFEGLTFQEIADLAGESVNTIAGRYRYALEKLRAALGTRESR